MIDKAERQLSVTIESSLKLPPAHKIRSDIEKLKVMQSKSRQMMRANRRSIRDQRFEQNQLRRLAKDPSSNNDGIIYNAEACTAAADQCDANIRMFESLNGKERAKIDQINGMLKEIEERQCLSEQMSRLIGTVVPAL